MSRSMHVSGVIACTQQVDKVIEPLSEANVQLDELMDAIEAHVSGGSLDGPGEEARALTAEVRTDLAAMLGRMVLVRTHLADYLARL